MISIYVGEGPLPPSKTPPNATPPKKKEEVALLVSVMEREYIDAARLASFERARAKFGHTGRIA